MKELLKKLYPNSYEEAYNQIINLINRYKSKNKKTSFSEKDSMIISYGDSLLDENKTPLAVLDSFLNKYIGDSVSAIHLLPMFPFTSDDGFSVIDYLKIDPILGNWENINNLSNNYDLMFDAVINHISKSSKWVKGYLNNEKEYEDFFIECNPSTDYSKVTRPRSLPLYHKYATKNGSKYLWTTFSEDQLDLNYSNPNVLIKVLEVLLEYSKNGAKYIRFDAIGFIWKKIGTSCIHLEETHILVKLMRIVLEECYPDVLIISETNVPHSENVSYFGNGLDEAHLVYQFPLPPLTLYSFLQQDASILSTWADNLKNTPLTNETTYFNFLASHDGIGMRPTEGILTDIDKDMMVENTIKKGGKIGYKNNEDGSRSPYELNINYLDALCSGDMSINQKVQKFMAAQSVLLSLKGIPGIYIHSILGSRNDIKGMEDSNINRRINREKININNLEKDLDDQNSLRYNILSQFKRLLSIRKSQSAFSPLSKQSVLMLDKRVFSLIRDDGFQNKILFIVNVTNTNFDLPIRYTGVNLINNKIVQNMIHLQPFEYAWIKLEAYI